jgi:calpain-15
VNGFGDSGGSFVDMDFPADESVVFGSADPTQGKPVTWIRASEVFPGSQLFDGIEPTDVCQGSLGDCWLLAAISALAEFPGAIESLFVTNRISPTGQYVIKLFDASAGWVEITIDDLLPVMDAEEFGGPGARFDGNIQFKPCFTSPNGNEIWVALLEKAVAKFCYSFGNLIGGQALYAWQIMTGCTELWEYRKSEDLSWQHVGVQYTDPRSVSSWSGFGGGDGVLDSEAFWAKLCECDLSNFVMGASCSGGVEDQLNTGLVTGHAYSLISCMEVDADGETHRMVCMRNPWGNDKEWNGRFSDTWGDWGSYPELASTLGVSGKAPDGKFWMCWEDFIANWDSVCVAAKAMDCLRGTNNTTRGIKLKSNKKFWSTATCGGNCSIM